MDRRKFIGLMTAGAAAGTVASPLVFGQERNPSSRPNFSFIIADDLTYRTIHSLNNPEIHTPNLDRLVASGCAFTHCFHQGAWTGAVCIPSRTMLNSGLTAFHAEVGLDRIHTWGQILGACDLAGISIPASVEFPSFAPLLLGKQQPLYDAVFTYHRHTQRAIRTKTHKLIVYPQVQKIQLFDIDRDPWEMHDLSDDPKMATVKAKLMQGLKRLQKELDDPLNLEDPLQGVWHMLPTQA